MSVKPPSAWLNRCQSNRFTAPSTSAEIARPQLEIQPVWRSGLMIPTFRSAHRCVQNH